MTVAWLRRKRLEARFIALDVVTLLGQALGGQRTTAAVPSDGTRNSESSDNFLRGMGVIP